MKAGKYSIKELFTNRYVEQIIVPEIQRDYVWADKEVEGLLNSIQEDYNRFSQGLETVAQPSADPELKKAFEEFYKKQLFSCNIGFIYAYSDAGYPGKYFLIDGQQRLTTIYLVLLVLAAKEPSFREKFEKVYMLSILPIVDYRVREASHRFLKEVVNNYKDNGINIENQPWCYNDYKFDQTISSIINNIKVIEKYLALNHLDTIDFIHYVQEHIEFWYFDTNISEQGEELYIYMNARGEQMQENENLKADLLGKIKTEETEVKSLAMLKNEWGTKWEDWQNFFWTKRQKNSNADKGFNEFINSIAGLENYLKGKEIIYKKEDFDGNKKGKYNQFAYHDIINSFDSDGLETISKYMTGLYYIFDKNNIDTFKSKYNNITWVEPCLDEILKLFNSTSTNWFADLKDPNRALEHSRMVFLWSILHYLNTSMSRAVRTNTEVFRVLRLYYIRFNNYNRSVQSINTDVNNINLYGPWKLTGIEEENKKNNWFTEKIKPEEIIEFEELIWNIEDHPLNLDGSDAQAINCSHLIDFNAEPSKTELSAIYQKFYELFPIDNKRKVNYEHSKKLATVLLFYGEYWERVSPWYCYNYHFGNWKKIIRNIGIANETFKIFFNEYKLESLESIYTKKVVSFDVDYQTTSLREQLKWFSTQVNTKIWEQGLYIVTDHYNNPGKDKVFENSKEILNTKGDFKGGNPQVLSKLVAQKNK